MQKNKFDFTKSDLYKYLLSERLEHHRNEVENRRKKQTGKGVWTIFSFITTLSFAYFSTLNKAAKYESIFVDYPLPQTKGILAVFIDTLLVAILYWVLYIIMYKEILKKIINWLKNIYDNIAVNLFGYTHSDEVNNCDEFITKSNQYKEKFNNVIVNQILMASSLAYNARISSDSNLMKYYLTDSLYFISEAIEELNNIIFKSKENIILYVDLSRDYTNSDLDDKLKRFIRIMRNKRIKEYRLKTIMDQADEVINFIGVNVDLIVSDIFRVDYGNLYSNYNALKNKLRLVSFDFDQGYQLRLFDINME